MLPPLKPIAMKERVSMVFLQKGQIDVKDGAFVEIDERRYTHAYPHRQYRLHHARTRYTRFSSCRRFSGQSGNATGLGRGSRRTFICFGSSGWRASDRLLYQAKLALDDNARLKVVRKMYEIRFGEKPPERRSVEQLRGIEGSRVKKTYQSLAKQAGVTWKGRNWDRNPWDNADMPNAVISSATALFIRCISEAAILAAGYAPAIGFIHTRQALIFCFMILLTCLSLTILSPVAFKIAAKSYRDPEREIAVDV